MIDLHCHILPGLDDGVRTLDEALALAAAAVADGIRTIAATPHVRADYPTSIDAMESGVAELREELARAGLGLELTTGAEVALDRLGVLTDDELARFTLGGGGRYLLLEFPYEGWPVALSSVVESLLESGVVPVLAHPERNAEVQADVERLRELADTGALVQVTAASVEGRLGRAAARASQRLLARGLVDLLATDAHGPLRSSGLAAAAAALGDASAARQLTVGAPAAILAGDAVPRPPRLRRWGRPPLLWSGRGRARNESR